MVRRERLVRRMRERATVADHGGNPSGRPQAVGRRMASFHRQFGRTNARTPGRLTSAPPAILVEMSNVETLPSDLPYSIPNLRRSPNISRRDWVQRRASALLGRQSMAEDVDREHLASLPACKLIPPIQIVQQC